MNSFFFHILTIFNTNWLGSIQHIWLFCTYFVQFKAQRNYGFGVKLKILNGESSSIRVGLPEGLTGNNFIYYKWHRYRKTFFSLGTKTCWLTIGLEMGIFQMFWIIFGPSSLRILRTWRIIHLLLTKPFQILYFLVKPYITLNLVFIIILCPIFFKKNLLEISKKKNVK